MASGVRSAPAARSTASRCRAGSRIAATRSRIASQRSATRAFSASAFAVVDPLLPIGRPARARRARPRSGRRSPPPSRYPARKRGGSSSIRSCSRAIESVVTPTCSPWKTSGRSGIGEHVDEVADQVLALARRLAVADDRRAEAREHQRADQPLDHLRVAAHQLGGAGEQRRLVVREQVERQLPVGRVEQEMRQQPVGLRRGAAQAVAEPGADQPRRGGRRGREIEEGAGRRLRRQARACGRAR